jgi:hypothetical protein
VNVISRLVSTYRRWKYLRAPRPTFEPTVTPVERHWTPTDEKLERLLYLANPKAFWLRPDRHEHKIPCWQIDGVWEAPPPLPLLPYANVAPSLMGGHGLFALQQGILYGAQMKQQAMIDRALAQNKITDCYAKNTSGLMRYGRQSTPSIFGGLGHLGRMF